MGAEDEHRRALALNPSSVAAHAGYGWYLQTASRFKEAIAEFDRALELDPTNFLARAQLIRALAFAAGDTSKAREEFRAAFVDHSPLFGWLDGHPVFDALHRDPAIDSLLRAAGGWKRP